MENPAQPENPVSSAAPGATWESEEAGKIFAAEGRVKVEEGDRNYAGNRWPREEAMALLDIRCGMDLVFKDSAHKAPLWEEVARKLAERGYNRKAKKCKEKFENIYKYYRRTKDCRSSQPNGKAYRFYEQLEALDNQNASIHCPAPLNVRTNIEKPENENIMLCITPSSILTPPEKEDTTKSIIPSSALNPPEKENIPECAIPISIVSPPEKEKENIMQFAIPNPTGNLPIKYNTSSSTSSSSRDSHKKTDRKLAFFERLVGQIMEKQEILQKNLIDAIEKIEQNRIAREEAWKTKESERYKQEHERLVKERSVAAKKDTAVLSFLQKYSGNTNSEISIPILAPAPAPVPVPVPIPVPTQEKYNLCDSASPSSFSRWPKEEIEALIKIRSNMDSESPPKGSLWEDISGEMKKFGYSRSAKRCKEKWENMNKYFKKVKESSKRRPEDAKTCPYFHQLDEIHKKKSRKNQNQNQIDSAGSSSYERVVEGNGAPEGQGRPNSGDESEGDYRVVAKNTSTLAIME